jgi:hypothetical protein
MINETSKRIIRPGQTWRRTHPNGGTQEFVVVNIFNTNQGRRVAGRTSGGKNINAPWCHMAAEDGRYEMLREAPDA